MSEVVKIYHSLIKKYENSHKGETCYIICPGKTLNDFTPLEEGTYIGCNLMIKAKHIINDPNFKYYFFGHGYNQNHSVASSHVMNYKENFKDEVDNLDSRIQKFCFVSTDGKPVHGSFNYEDLLKINAIPIELTLGDIHADVSMKPFINHMAVLPCIQFALYAGFTKIYFVGADCVRAVGDCSKETHYFFQSSMDEDHFYGSMDKNQVGYTIKVVSYLKTHFYPNTKFININPSYILTLHL